MAEDGPTRPQTLSAFRNVPRTGVIYVMSEAAKAGYSPDDPNWTNFGQGQPEAGTLPGSPERVGSVSVDVNDHEYAPVAGLWELRTAVAEHYNRRFRRGKPSQYTAENVCISPGGRAALTRIAASLGTIHLGHFLPDYTAYEELLDLFRLFSPTPILLDPERGYDFSIGELRREILGRGLSAILLSNPCNPTGKLIAGESLQAWVATARSLDCTMIFDEFYSHYIWDNAPGVSPTTATAAHHVEDVDRDPILIVNGLTKNYRYPGWRISWTLGPKSVIDRIASAGSFLDGGGNRPLQRAAIPLLDDGPTQSEMEAIRTTFRAKRDLMLSRLQQMGIRVERPPGGTFYVWGDVSGLPDGFRSGRDFFRKGLENQFICVPGEFFDVNPGQRRATRRSRFRNHIRFSFGPAQHTLEAGLDRMERAISAG
jgi:N-succinyldiaminopimelate aminotransferase